jgi:hypothetical protein
MTGEAYKGSRKINPYIIIKRVQWGIFAAYWRGTSNPVCRAADNTPVHSFTSRKEAVDYLIKTEIV